MFEALNSVPVNGSSAPIAAPAPEALDVLGKLGISIGFSPGYGVELAENGWGILLTSVHSYGTTLTEVKYGIRLEAASNYGVDLGEALSYGITIQQAAYGVILNDN